jgi:spermidine synthase
VEYVEVARDHGRLGETVLRRRLADGAVELRVNGVFVMDTVETGSERALARSALAAVDDPADVLVGGLGLGVTADEVLADHRVRRLVVVEVEEAVLGWLREGVVPHGPSLLADERLSVVVTDVREAVEEAATSAYDVVLLDVDNGPGYLVHEQNAELYAAPFLGRLRRVVRPGGAVVVWSASPAPELEAAMVEVFDDVVVQPHPVRLHDREEAYWLYLARVRSSA